MIFSISGVENRQTRITNYRDYVAEVQRRQADKMVAASNKRYGTVEVGQTVRIPVEPMDRGKTDPRNVLAVVMNNTDGYYTLGTPSGLAFSWLL
jgi:cytochrome c-type biogenesis protein CcmH/NrfG